MNRKIKNILIKVFIDKPRILEFLRNVQFLIKCVMHFLMSWLFSIFNIKDKLVFINYYGKGVGDNGLYIYKKINERKLNVKLVWLVDDVNNEEKLKYSNISFVKNNSLKSVYEMMTAKVWINNCRLEKFYFKRKKQFYIQTWHGGLILKKIEKDVESTLGQGYVRIAKNDSKKADLILSNSTFISNIIKKSFWYNGKVLESGYPRSDILFEDNSVVREKVRKHYKLHEHTKIVLYAPTFRQDNSLKPYFIDMESVLKQLELLFSGDWIFAIRLHPNISNIDADRLFAKTLDLTNYPDMQELITASDALITDYSSCMFDSAMAKIPTFLYATDIDEYIKDRGFYFQLDELPFSVSENSQELVTNISKFNQDKYLDDLNQFYEKVGLVEDGKASDRVVDVIEQVVAGTYPR